MLRNVGLALEIAGSVLAFGIPISLVSWICKTANIEVGKAILGIFDPLFAPFMSIVRLLSPVHTINMGGNVTNIDMPLMSVLLFVLSAFCFAFGRGIKDAERKVQVAVKSHTDHRAAQQRVVEQQQHREMVVSEYKPLVYVNFPFQEHIACAKYFASFKNRGGRPIQTQPDNAFFEFERPEEALNYIVESKQRLQEYYNTLRPMDPQPPFRSALVAIQGHEDFALGLERCHHVLKFTGENDMLFTSDFHELMNARGVNKEYRYYSLGEYLFPGGVEREVYRLEGLKGPSTFR